MTKPNQWSLVFAAGLVSFVAMLDRSIITVALPTLQRDFGISPEIAQWIVLGYSVPLIALILPCARWLDHNSTRSSLLFSVTGFAVASGLAAGAQEIGLLIAARVAQGCFGAIMFTLMPVLATIAVRPEARGRAMGVLVTMGSLGAVSGPALGGLLMELSGWRTIFLVNLPVCLLVIVIGVRNLVADGRLRIPHRASVIEALLLGGATGSALLMLTLSVDHGPPWLGLAVVPLTLFLAWRRLPASATVLNLLRVPAMARLHCAVLAMAVAFTAVHLLMPFYLQRVLAASAPVTGMVLLAFPLAMGTVGPIGGLLADRWGTRRTALAGATLMTAGLALLVPLATTWVPVELAWRLAVAGAGMGLYGGPVQSMTMTAAPPGLLATTGGSVQLARAAGFALGPALATALWALSHYSTDGMRAGVGLAVTAAAMGALALTIRAPTAVRQAPH